MSTLRGTRHLRAAISVVASLMLVLGLAGVASAGGSGAWSITTNASTVEGNSGSHVISFNVHYDHSLSWMDDNVSVHWATSNGTAIGGGSCAAGVDYLTASGTMTVNATADRDTAVNVTVCGDTTFENDETLRLTLSAPSPLTYVTGTNPRTGTIVNDDLPPTTTTVITSGTPSTYGQSVTFTATVSPAAATGTIHFRDGANDLGTVVLTSGHAALPTAALSAGSHTLYADYSGNASYAGSTGSVAQSVSAFGTAHHLAFGLQPSNATAGASIGNVKVIVQDQYNNTVGSSSASIGLALQGGTGNLSSTPSTAWRPSAASQSTEPERSTCMLRAAASLREATTSSSAALPSP
jgi:hypothetical protein